MLYKYLPYPIFRPLFGDRRRFGVKIIPDDPDYILWQQDYERFYRDTQKKGIGRIINHWGFRITREIDLTGKVVLEVGPGILEHLRYAATRPREYVLADTQESFLRQSEKCLLDLGVTDIKKIKVEGIRIPWPPKSFDVIFSFHQLEHILELEPYLLELKRLLKPGGILAGAVPTEGGIVWGTGRWLTSRRYVRRQGSFNYDKIICWEHPNFADRIKSLLDKNFMRVRTVKKPLGFLPMDFNLSWSFIYQNTDERL